jgi:hypothetical protein
MLLPLLLRDVTAAYDCHVGVDGLLGVVVRGDGLRSRRWERSLMIREVIVLGLRKDVVRSALKTAVRWRSPWPWEKLQRREIQLSRLSMRESAEESGTVFEAKHGLGDIFVLAQKIGVNSNIAVILNWEWRCSWWLVELMFLPRVKRVGSMLGGNVWRWMTKVLCKPKRWSGCCCVMQRLRRASQMVVVCGLLVERMMPSMLWMLRVLSEVQMHTFLVEMMCMMSYPIMRWERSRGDERVLDMLCFQQEWRAKNQ